MSINRVMDKEGMVHIYDGILLSHKKHEIMPFVATKTNLEIIILSDVSHTKEDKYYITYMWNLEKQTHRLRKKLMVTKWERKVGG